MRLIDADALKDEIAVLFERNPNLIDEWLSYQVEDAIDDASTIEERKKGKWIDMGDFEQCSVCTGTHLKEVNTVYGTAIWIKSAYCPNCGADMRGGEK